MSIVTTVEGEALSIWQKWSARIVGVLCCIVILVCCALYTRHLRHELADAKQVQVTQVAQDKADTSANKAYTASNKKTKAKKEKADVVIAHAVAANPESSASYFPDDLADALRDPADDSVHTKSDHTTGHKVSATVPDNLPAVEIAR